jgi:hypothetical protein
MSKIMKLAEQYSEAYFDFQEMELSEADLVFFKNELQTEVSRVEAELAALKAKSANGYTKKIESLIAERDALRAEKREKQEPVAFAQEKAFDSLISETVLKLTKKAYPEYGFIKAIYDHPAPGAGSVPMTDKEVVGGVLTYKKLGARNVCGSTIGADGSGEFAFVVNGSVNSAWEWAKAHLATLGNRATEVRLVLAEEDYSGPRIRILQVDEAHHGVKP